MTSSVPTDDSAFVTRFDLGGDGATVAIKDCIDIAGHPTRCGSRALEKAPPAARNAEVVDNILAAGCRIVGKTNLHELAFGMTGENPHFGTPVNPRWPELIPGGSSSGSAVAVASGAVDFAVGTDTGGSIRQPAICCGILGMKPTFGRVSRRGVKPASSSLDCVGVFARDMPMLTRAMEAIDPTFAPCTLTHRPRLARVRADVDDEVGQALVYPLMDGLSELDYVTLTSLDAAFDAGMTLISRETADAWSDFPQEDAQLGADIRARLSAARSITSDAVAKAEVIRTRFTEEVDTVLKSADALITPALPSVPPTLSAARDPATVLPLTRFLRPFNLSGHPAIVLPSFHPISGLPIGLQLVGRKGEDAKLCAIATWLTKCLPTFSSEDSLS